MQLPGLFDGCHFYLHGDYEYPAPTRENFTALLRSGGATILSREPKLETINQADMTVPYHANPSSAMACCSHFKVSSNTRTKPELTGSRMASVAYTWVFDCVTNFQILEISK